MEKGSIATVFGYGLADFNQLMKVFKILLFLLLFGLFVSKQMKRVRENQNNFIEKKNLVNILKLFKGSLLKKVSNNFV